jgi:hypothetical protein
MLTESNATFDIKFRYDNVEKQPQFNLGCDGHIFNSGPLMDDPGDGSDYDEYFPKPKTPHKITQ